MNTNRKTKPRADWHPADIKAELEKRGWSLARIGREYRYALPGPNNVLRKPWPVLEQIIADILGVHPSDIWPSRYNERRQPRRVDIRSFERLRAKQETSKGETR